MPSSPCGCRPKSSSRASTYPSSECPPIRRMRSSRRHSFVTPPRGPVWPRGGRRGRRLVALPAKRKDRRVPGSSQSDRRPSPDALLEAAAREQRARLKVFVGAAPGVGKTYAMLQAAQQRRRDGYDVVVGIVETHGRTETAALL